MVMFTRSEPHLDHTATLPPSGEVLVAGPGGMGQSSLPSSGRTNLHAYGTCFPYATIASDLSLSPCPEVYVLGALIPDPFNRHYGCRAELAAGWLLYRTPLPILPLWKRWDEVPALR
jgi:hypothetical protein